MVCKHCNRVLPDNTSYCIYCGARVDQEPITAMKGNGAEVNVTAPYTVPVGMTEEAYLSSLGQSAQSEPAAPVVPPVIPVDPPAEQVETIPVIPVAPIQSTVPVEVVPTPAPTPIPTQPAFQVPAQPAFQVPVAGKGGNVLNMVQRFWWAAVAAALVLALVLGISLGSAKDDLAQLQQESQDAQVAYEDEIKELKNTVQSQKGTISDQQDQIDSMQKKVDIYDSMFEIISTHNMGMATYNFQATTDFMVLKKGNSAKFNLTAYWRDGGEVYLEHSSSCVDVVFDKDNWVKTVSMTAIPKEPGFCVVTFSNSADANTFSMLFLVTE